MRKHWKRTLSLLAVTVAVALVSAGLALGKKPPKPPPEPPPELPPVRYRISFPALPGNSTGGFMLNDINNLGQVVGRYIKDPGTGHAFLYDPITDQSIDLNAVVADSLPEGWHFYQAIGINDWQVVVGSIKQTGVSPSRGLPVAVDMAAANPVLDLLPDVGDDYSYALHINENGDILGRYYDDAEGHYEYWVFNPNLYGAPSQRQDRDGTPLDMSAEVPDRLSDYGITGAPYSSFYLNNPVGSQPAQIAGNLVGDIVFRYTLGDETPELFPTLNYMSGGINDAGTFSGRLYVPRERNRKAYYAPFRYNPDWADPLDELPKRSNIPSDQNPRDMNQTGDLLFNGELYRDDWGDEWGARYVKIDDLVVGDPADLAVWFSETSTPWFVGINDRAGDADSGQITGGIRVDGGQSIFFVLTPEPAQ